MKVSRVFLAILIYLLNVQVSLAFQRYDYGPYSPSAALEETDFCDVQNFFDFMEKNGPYQLPNLILYIQHIDEAKPLLDKKVNFPDYESVHLVVNTGYDKNIWQLFQNSKLKVLTIEISDLKDFPSFTSVNLQVQTLNIIGRDIGLTNLETDPHLKIVNTFED